MGLDPPKNRNIPPKPSNLLFINELLLKFPKSSQDKPPHNPKNPWLEINKLLKSINNNMLLIPQNIKIIISIITNSTLFINY